MYLKYPLESLQQEIRNLEDQREDLKAEENELNIAEIKRLENIVDEFKEAEKAIIHASTIDKYIRETMIFPYSRQKSMRIAKNLIAFIHANRRMFEES